MRLDVGCGLSPSGDVNTDRFLTPKVRLQDPAYPIPENTPNFHICDGQYLPFKDNVFEEVVSFHVIEHVPNPVLFLKELIRVSKGKIVVKCPHRFSRFAKSAYHIQYFNISWFNKILTRLREKIKIWFRVSIEYRGYPHPYISILSLPSEITVTIRKI